MGYTQEKMGQICGIKKSAYSMIENGHSHLSLRNRHMLLEALSVNECWLDEGVGDMFSSKRPIFENPDKVMAARRQMRMVPLFNMDMVGRSFAPHESLRHIQRYVPFMHTGPDDLAAIVAGNNMAPTLPAGSVVLLSRVYNWQTFIEFGQAYVIVLRDGRRLLREIRRYKQRDKIVLHSKNEACRPSVLPLKLVTDIFMVKAVYKTSV